MSTEQLSLFAPKSEKPQSTESKSPAIEMPATTHAPLSAQSSLAAAIKLYPEQMRRQNLSPHTIQAFSGDLNLFQKYLGDHVTLDQISVETIHKFMSWLRYERDVPCSPKTYERRLTTLKVFFSWLKQTQVIFDDPAAPVAHIPVTSPLPEILYDDQIAKLHTHARSLFTAEKSDARPLLLVALLLSTGVKKSEAMAIRLIDLDAADPKNAALYVRYSDAKKRHKERKIKLSPEFATTLPRYIEQYKSQTHLFECTSRTLEYVLADLAQATGLGDTVSFESMRWTCAVQDYKNGMTEDHIRLKLGLSTITWEEAGEKLKTLAGKAL